VRRVVPLNIVLPTRVINYYHVCNILHINNGGFLEIIENSAVLLGPRIAARGNIGAKRVSMSVLLHLGVIGTERSADEY